MNKKPFAKQTDTTEI